MESWVVSLQLISFCLFHIGLIVQDHSDPMFSSYAYKSHYLLNESNRAELMKLPMIPSSSASKKKCEKGNNQNSLSLAFIFAFPFFFFFFSLNEGGKCMPVKHHLLLLVNSTLVVVTVSSYGCNIIKKGLK